LVVNKHNLHQYICATSGNVVGGRMCVDFQQIWNVESLRFGHFWKRFWDLVKNSNSG